MKRYFIGDLHGSKKALDSVFNKIDIENNEVYFMGDYIDRGANSKEVLETLKKLTEENENVFCLLGNHDKMLIDFVANGDNLGFLNDPNLNTLKSIFEKKLYFDGRFDIFDENSKNITKELRLNLLHNPLYLWLLERPYFLQTNKQIIVHAGVDKLLNNWMDTDLEDMIWVRPNTNIKNNTGKDIIVGHTITSKFIKPKENEQPQIYISSQGNEYYIDTANFLYDNARILEYDIDTDKYSIID